MKPTQLAFVLALTLCLQMPASAALLIAGVDFEDGVGGWSNAPDDLNGSDGITVSSGWTDGNPTNDNNANTAGAYEGNFPARLQATAAYFSITIPDGVVLDLDQVFFAVRGATGTTGAPSGRQVRFRTSLEGATEWLFENTNLPGRNNSNVDNPSEWVTASLNLTDAKYDGLTNTTIQFIFGTSGGVDLDGITVSGTIVPEPSSAALIGFGGLALLLRRRRS